MKTQLQNFVVDTAAFWGKIRKTASCWEWTGGVGGNGYGQINVWIPGGKTTARTHRVAYELANGPIPEDMEVDHICHNRACANPGHLRLLTHKHNTENFSGLTARNSSGHRGVTWAHRCQKWVARVCHNGTTFYVGVFDSAEEAGAAAAAKRIELFTYNDLDRKAAA